MDFLIPLVSFIVAIGILVTVHEFGHFWVARRVGVRVLRFSIGFGRPLWRRVGRDGVEYVVASLPLGGYVKMLDEREGDVPPEEADRAFNRKPLWARNAVILAGPAFNFLFAILVYWAIFIAGTTALAPVLGPVATDSPAAEAGFRAGDELLAIGGEPVRTWNEAVITLLDQGVGADRLVFEVQTSDGAQASRTLDLTSVAPFGEDRDLLEALGFSPFMPRIDAVLGEVPADGPAGNAGLRTGDRIESLNGEPIDDWRSLVEAVQSRPGETVTIAFRRDGELRTVTLTLDRRETNAGEIGRIGAGPQVEGDPYASMRREIRYNPAEAAWQATVETWDLSVLTLKMLWKMVIGEASVKNLSGPINIAQFAGQSAELGLTPFLKFLAVVSISLGILNLLPVPVLDGGHLLFNGIEWARGKPLSEQAQGVGVQIGLVLLFMLMALAFYNDILRVFGPN